MTIAYVLVVIINTQFNISIDFFAGQPNMPLTKEHCEQLATRINKKTAGTASCELFYEGK
ncbi:MAG: hypothetical protein ACXW2E_01140 [Nitrososphaeraceae archaeon]